MPEPLPRCRLGGSALLLIYKHKLQTRRIRIIGRRNTERSAVKKNKQRRKRGGNSNNI